MRLPQVVVLTCIGPLMTADNGFEGSGSAGSGSVAAEG